MSSKFSSVVLKSKRSSSVGGGKAKSSSNLNTSAISSMQTMQSSTKNTSKSRTNKQPPGASKSPTKILLKAACPTTFTKKSSSTLNGSRQSTPVLSSTSDDLSKALVLKKKNVARCSRSAVERNTVKMQIDCKNWGIGSNVADCTKTTAEAATANNENIDDNNLSQISSYKETATGGFAMYSEGPLEIPAEHFDFYSILSRSKFWETDADEEEGKSGCSSSAEEIKSFHTKLPAADGKGHSILAPVPSSPSCSRLKTKESEIWGELRTSTADESSSPPSLTSIDVAEEEQEKELAVEDSEKVNEEVAVVELDENNNVLETIKNTIYRSFTFFEISRSSTTTTTTTATTSAYDKNGEMERKETGGDYDEGNIRDSFSASKELDQVNGSEGKINTQPCHNGNVHNSPTPLGFFLRGTSQDSILIPLDIKTDLHKAFHVHSSRPGSSVEESQLDFGSRLVEHVPCLETKLENGKVANGGESLSEEEPPPLTEIQQSREEIKDSSSSLQLVLNGFEKEVADEAARHFLDDLQRTDITHISPKSSYTSAAADEESFYTDTMQTLEEFDSQETQTQNTASHDAETGTEDKEGEEKKEKLMSLVMAVNTGVDITPSPEDARRAVRLRGIIKACRPESIHIEGSIISSRSMSKLTDDKVRRCAVLEKIKHPQTFTQVGADYGFPADISISGIIGNIVTMTWASTDKGDVNTNENETEKKGANNITSSSYVVGSRLMGTAYDILNAGLKYASDLIGVEAELEPREDWIRYNGYKIRVCGRKLLLESLHVNCDFNIDGNGVCCRSNRSFTSLKPSWSSRTELVQSCEGRRIRIVVRVAGPLVQETEQANSALAIEHNVLHSDGKWTFIFGNGENGDNFIEIGCPNGVHPESLAYGVLNGVLLVDAP